MAFKDKHFRSVFYILLMGIFAISRFAGSSQPGFFAVTNEKEEGRLGVGIYLGFITLVFSLEYLVSSFSRLIFYCIIKFAYTESPCSMEVTLGLFNNQKECFLPQSFLSVDCELLENMQKNAEE